MTVQQLRAQLCLTQAAFGKKFGVSERTVRRLESGETGVSNIRDTKARALLESALSKQTVAVDFDGVINSYKSGWSSTSATPESNIPDAPVKGAREGISALRKQYRVVIFSARAKSESGIAAMKEWLNKYDIQVDAISHTKPPCLVIIDDRAIRFDGEWDGMAEKVQAFKTWQQR